EALMPLRLARIGVPLSQTAPEGLAAAGIEPAPLPPVREAMGVVEPVCELPPAAWHVDGIAVLSSTWPEVPEAAPSAVTGVAGVATSSSPTAGVDLVEAGWLFFNWYGRLPTVAEFGAFLARDYGLIDPETGGIIADTFLEPVLAELDADQRTDADADAAAEQPPSPMTQAPAGETERVVPGADSESHPFISLQAHAEGQDSSGAPETAAAPMAASTEAASTPSGSEARLNPAPPAEPVPSQRQALVIPGVGEAQEGVVEVAATGEATARTPRQQIDSAPASDPIELEVAQVAAWLTEAAETGTRLSGAEVARRLKVSPKTGQRRVIDATRHLEEHGPATPPPHAKTRSSNT
ncbi:hypothetical protein ACFV9E_11715, partial [Streptomyces sp. NPDC059835]